MGSSNVRRVAWAVFLSLIMALIPSGPVEGAALTRVALKARQQAVEVQGTGTAQFKANGAGRFQGDSGPFLGAASLRTQTTSYTFRFQEAEIIEDASGSPIGLELSGQARVARGGRQELFAFTATVRPDPTMAECLIYDFVGPNVHLRFVAVSTLRISG
jgi:hypothetical protein